MSAGMGIRLIALGLVVALSLPWSATGQEPTEPTAEEVAPQPTLSVPVAPEGSEGPAPQSPGVTRAAPPPAAGQTSGFCDATEIALSRVLALQTEEVAWRAAGLMVGSRVSPRAVDLLAPTGASVLQLPSALVSNQCEATATFLAADLGPGTYAFTVVGTTARGVPVELTSTFSIVATSRLPTLTPTTTRPLPAPPGGLRASAVNANTIRLDWSDNSTNETGFRIDSDAGQFRTPPNMVTFNAGGLQPLTPYCFSLYAFNDAGESFGGAACAFTLAAPPRSDR